MKNGFHPTILEDPNRFDAYCQDELHNEVTAGMKQFEELKAGNINSLGISTAEIATIISSNKKYAHLASLNDLLTKRIQHPFSP